MVKKKQKRAFKKSSLKNLSKPVSFILSGLLIAILLWQYSQNRSTSLQYLDQQGSIHTIALPVKDKDRLDGLMKLLFAQDSFAYTILGSKPVSWAPFQNTFTLSDWIRFYDSFSEYNRKMRSGCYTWEKYQHLFPSSHLWIEYPKDDRNWVSILIVNEDRFNEVVNKNKRDFQEVIHRDIVDGFQLLIEAKNRSLMNDILQNHQALMGIVLGYGRDNSWKFLKGCENRAPIGWVWEDEDSYFGKDSVESDDTSAYYYLSRYSCPSFAGDPNSEESLALKKEYLMTKQKVLDYYKGKDFLEATLSLLAGYRPPNSRNYSPKPSE